MHKRARITGARSFTKSYSPLNLLSRLPTTMTSNRSTQRVSPTEQRNVVVLGKTGGGKSTVANKIIETESGVPPFQISDRNVANSVTTETKASMAVLQTNDDRHYNVKVIDTVGFFDTNGKSNKEVMSTMKRYVREHVPIGLHLVLFIYKNGRWTKEEQDTFDFVTKNFREEISAISALVVTGCDGFDVTQRDEIVDDFKQARPDIADFMQKGIFPVGFPDLNKLKASLREIYIEDIKADQETLRGLVYSCEELKLSKEILGESLWEKASRCTIL